MTINAPQLMVKYSCYLRERYNFRTDGKKKFYVILTNFWEIMRDEVVTAGKSKPTPFEISLHIVLFLYLTDTNPLLIQI